MLQEVDEADLKSFQIARVAEEHKNAYTLLLQDRTLPGKLSGRFEYIHHQRMDWPAVGDFVLVQDETDLAIIHRVLPRRTQLVRTSPGSQSREQIIGSNIDTVLIVSSLNQDFNPRRIERYISLCRQGQTTPVVVLSKLDLVEHAQKQTAALKEIAPDVEVLALSVQSGQGLGGLEPYLQKGQTIALVGSSGVGKSTLVNALLENQVQEVREIREDDGKGKHTTSGRSLHILASGALMMDTPGMRELGLWKSDDESQGGLFADIEALQAECEFRDCQHESDTGCAVLREIEAGKLDPGRWQNYLKLKRQQAFLNRQVDARLAREEKKRFKDFSKKIKSMRKAGVFKRS
jgi:ribosome biogenesis GTPase